jgi:hypothetical protein
MKRLSASEQKGGCDGLAAPAQKAMHLGGVNWPECRVRNGLNEHDPPARPSLMASLAVGNFRGSLFQVCGLKPPVRRAQRAVCLEELGAHNAKHPSGPTGPSAFSGLLMGRLQPGFLGSPAEASFVGH